MGKGGGALNTWLKEFTTLVFTQTIQAFIFAIIISLILFGMVNTSEDITDTDHNSALGLMATFALLSVFKVEDMARKIFGLGDSKASNRNAMRAIAKTAFAAKLGAKTLNNAGKVIGGVRAIGKARQDRRKLASRMDQDKADYGIDAKDSNDSALDAVHSVDGGGSGGSGGSGASVPSGGGSSAAAAIARNAQQVSNLNKKKLRDALRQYEDQLKEINKARDEGIKSIASGLTESVGALFGGTAGAILSSSDGNFDDVVAGIVAGAGAGDVVGKQAVDAIDKSIKFVQGAYNHKAGMSNRELQAKIKELEASINNLPSVNGSGRVDDM